MCVDLLGRVLHIDRASCKRQSNQQSEDKRKRKTFFSSFLTLMHTVGLVEVTNIDSTVSTGTENILAPGAMGFQINPPGVLSFRATIASASPEWATSGQTPLFDCLYMTNAQWIAYIDPQLNPGQVGVFGTRVANCTRASSVFAQPGGQWIVLDNKANFGVDPVSDPTGDQLLSFAF
jgi:hypothetical protein